MLVFVVAGISIHVEAVLWSLLALVGLAASVWLYRDTLEDERDIERDGRNGAWKRLIRIRKRTVATRIWCLTAFLVIGAQAGVASALQHAVSRPYTPSGGFFTALMFAAEIALIRSSVMDALEWDTWLDEVKHRIARARAAGLNRRSTDPQPEGGT